MNKTYCKTLLAALLLGASTSMAASAQSVTLGEAPVASAMAAVKAAATGKLVINGTGKSATFTVNAANLPDKITLRATPGLEVYPETLPADAKEATIRVTLLSSLPQTDGMVILRSGDYRAEMQVTGYGTPLTHKDLSASPVTTENKSSWEATGSNGFTPGENGYTVEFRLKLNRAGNEFQAFGVTPDAGSFMGYVTEDQMGFYNGKSKVSFNNPLSVGSGATGQFYNRDGKAHTYRFSVTPDKRVFVYRDGVEVGVVRAGDYGHQADWAVTDGELSENLLKNADFEGEFNYRASDSLLNKVEGWIVDPIDQYNCTYDVINHEINNDLDQYNHVMKLQRYNWNDGWGAGTVSQIVDVAPNTTYSLSFLAQGGFDSKNSVNLSQVKLQEVQNTDLGTSVTITNEDEMKEYGLNYTTSADCKQLKVVLYNERFLNGGGWGSHPTAALFDQMALVGPSRGLDTKVGYNRPGGTIEYFTFDATGAYAPVTPVLEPAESAVSINGVGNSKTIDVNIANLISADKVKVSATSGFSVTPETLDANANGKITVTLTSTLPETTGKIILRSGDLRKYIDLYGENSDLPVKDIKATPAYAGGNDAEFTHNASNGFTAGAEGYTVEFRGTIKNSQQSINAYGVTTDGAYFKAYVDAEDFGLFNGTQQISIENPATADDGGLKKFYNKDGKAHTYRFAVTSDKRVAVYRDGMFVGNFRTTDYATQKEWAVADGDVKENLLINGTFEGEYNKRSSDNQVNRIEGWHVEPIDQYNCQYDVINHEINNDLDLNNHVAKLQRYNWNDGWGAGTVSQIVDVAPNSTYSLSFLAQGGFDSKNSVNLSKMKIQEVGNSDLGDEVTITNEDEMKEYGLSYTTSADCKQLKVILYNERFLNGGGWGSSPSAALFDNVVLAGQSRKLDQAVGFSNVRKPQIEYFAYDCTGAFAPAAPDFGDDFVGIDDVFAGREVSAVTTADGVALYDTPVDAAVTVYDSMGKTVAKAADYCAGDVIALPGKGIYIAVVAADGQSKTVKFAN